MSEPEAGLGPPERLHPASLLSSLGASIRGMWGLFAAGGVFAVQGRWEWAIIGVAAFVALSLVSAIINWLKFSYRVGAREIRIDSGFLSRTHRSIPFDRIQDVTLEQGPVARLLGLARVRFETGASAGAGEDDGSLAAIPLERAAELRELVRASRGLGQVATEAGADEPEPEPVFAMDLRRVVLAGVFNFSLAVLGVLFGLSQTIGEAVGFDPFDDKFWDDVLAVDSPIADFIRAYQVAAVIAGFATLILVGLGTGLIRTLLREYGFRLDRRETALRRRRGLITLTDVSLPLRRIRAAIIASGPVRARFGWSELKLQSLASDDGGKGNHVVAPLACQDEVDGILGSLGWPRVPGDTEWHKVARAYVWSFAILLAPLVAIAGLQVAALGITPHLFPTLMDEALLGALSRALVPASLFLVALFALVVMRWLAWRRYGYAAGDERLLVRSGWWQRRLTILPLKSIESIDFTQSFVERWFGIASLRIGVAGGGMTQHGVRALPAETARALRRHLLARLA